MVFQREYRVRTSWGYLLAGAIGIGSIVGAYAFVYYFAIKPESTEGGRRVSILKWPEGALLNLG